MNISKILLAVLLAASPVFGVEITIRSSSGSVPQPKTPNANEGAVPKPPAEKLAPEEVERLVNALESEDFEERESATKRLFRAAEYPVLCRLYALAEKTQDTEVRGRVEQLIPAILKEMGDAIYDMDFQFLGPIPFLNEDAEGKALQFQNMQNQEWIRYASPIDNVESVDLKKEFSLKPFRGAGDFQQDNDASNAGAKKGETIKAAWTRPFEGKRGVIDFCTMYPEHPQWVSVYALTFIKAEKACQAKLFIGSDDGLGVWVNGKCVVFHDIRRAVVRDQDKMVVDLKPGWNPVMMRITNGWGGWGLSFRITQMNGMAWNEQDVSPTCRGEQMPLIPAPKQPKDLIKPGETAAAAEPTPEEKEQMKANGIALPKK